MTDHLVAFVRARLDDVEQTARAVEDRSAPWDGQWVADGDAARTFNGHVLFYGHGGPLKAGLVAHVVRHDPAHVLAEVEADRLLLTQYEYLKHDVMSDDMTGVFALEKVLRAKAAVHADHPDYRPEWRA